MKKKVYIISHSHWDREWYLPYEQHHMRLVELMDDLLDLFKTDPSFNSFHLDGQTIILDDYLQVRPEKRAEVQQAINAGKLRIGPFYILQDDFLISSEANVRNMLIGHEESKKWGTPVMLGYFPDTFGNMGQTPQMLKKAGLNVAAYGRGVKPIGFDNEVLKTESYTSQYSEMWWEGPDKSQILGILFANWYSNGNEIPTEKEEALAFWKQKLADVEKFGSTNHYLMMNGVDHQPVQKDVTKAIALANELFPDYEFIHSNFTDYINAVSQDLPKDLGKVTGELTSQETDGWFTLANTASARVYLKQWNTKVERQLENIAEPLASMAYEVSGKYPHDQLTYAWKTLMQNHPHDSICGCSVDEVHREMMPRFEKAYEVGKYVEEEALRVLGEAINPKEFPKDSYPFVVFNTTGYEKTEVVSIDVSLKRKTFKEGYPSELFAELENEPENTYELINKEGKEIPGMISKEKVRYGYDLPKDRFRIPYMEKYVTVTLQVEKMSPFFWETFALVNGTQHLEKTSLIKEEGRLLENEWLTLRFSDNGTLKIKDKETKKELSNLLVFEDVGDIGNEYIFKQPENDHEILSSDTLAEFSIVKDTFQEAVVKITQTLMIPESATDLLKKEQQAVVDFRNRQATRSKKLVPLLIETFVTLTKGSKRVNFETRINNQMKDHRLRVLFPTDFSVTTHEADSIYEVVTRENEVSSSWKNPTNPQHQQVFVNLHDDTSGLTVSNFGLNEYEILQGKTIALTLLRCVGELGDWGYFPTPEAQCLGNYTFSYGLELHGKPQSRYGTYFNAYSAQVPAISLQLKENTGKLNSHHQFIAIKGDTFGVTALKRNQETNQLILRGFNLSDQVEKLSITKEGKSPRQLVNLLEESPEPVTETLTPYEIRTMEF